ncbi:MAG: hypothetical protein ACOC58_04995 [Chloroflexota bacterium]
MANTHTQANTRSSDAERADRKRTQAEPEFRYVGELAGAVNALDSLLDDPGMELPVEKHAGVLGDVRFAHPANASRKARVASHLQQTHGNAYVQRLLDSNKTQARPPVDRVNGEYEPDLNRKAEAMASPRSVGVKRQPIQASVSKDDSEKEAASERIAGADRSGMRGTSGTATIQLQAERGSEESTASAGNTAIVNAARARASGKVGKAYAQTSAIFHSPNGGLASKKASRTVKGEYDVEWGKCWKCNCFVYDALYKAGLNPPLNSDKHYYNPKNSLNLKYFKTISPRDVLPGDIVIYPSFGDNGHMEIITSPVKEEGPNYKLRSIGAHKNGVSEQLHSFIPPLFHFRRVK